MKLEEAIKRLKNDEDIIEGLFEDIVESRNIAIETVLQALEEKDKIIDLMAECINNYQICNYEITEYPYRKCEFIADDETPPCADCIKDYFRKKAKDE